jgi:hypothetical protein
MGFVLQLHSIWQWAILVFAGLVALKALIGWQGKQTYTVLDDRIGMVLTIALDLQFLLGLLLWLFGPINFRQLSSAMGNDALRFYLLEHNVIYLIALVLAHIGRGRARKATDGVAKHRASFIFFALSFVFILAIIVMR